MRYPRKALLSCFAGLAAAIAAAPGAIAQGPSAAAGPHIRARPSSAMIDTHVALNGSGFPANSVVALRECGRTFWLAPTEPCDTANAKLVRTGRLGRFKTSFLVELCPEGEPGEIVTERTCFIGEPVFGEDTGMLEGAAKITVTYP
jgi:hypothetical protein